MIFDGEIGKVEGFNWHYPTEYSSSCPWIGEVGYSHEQSLLPQELRWMAAFLPVGELVQSGRKWAKLAQQAAAVSPIPPSNPKSIIIRYRVSRILGAVS